MFAQETKRLKKQIDICMIFDIYTLYIESTFSQLNQEIGLSNAQSIIA